MESPEFKGVLNFRSKLSWLHLAYLDIGFRFGPTKVEISNSLINILKLFLETRLC